MRPAGWLPATLRAIDRSGFRRDRKRNLRQFATALAGRAARHHRAVLFLLDETAEALGLSRRSVTRYRLDLAGLGRLTTIEEGSTPASRGPAHPHLEDEGNRAAVLAFVEPARSRNCPPASPSVDGDLSQTSRTRETTGRAPRDGASTNDPAPDLHPRDRRGRSRRVAAALRERLEELAGASVAGIATVLRHHALDGWSVDELATAVRFRPDWSPWLVEHEPVANPRGWLSFRLRPHARGARPSLIRDALDGGRARRRRELAELEEATAVPVPAEIVAAVEERRRRRSELARRQEAEAVEARARRRAWLLSTLPDPENPWPATRVSERERRRDDVELADVANWSRR